MTSSTIQHLSNGSGDGVRVNRSNEGLSFFGGTPVAKPVNADLKSVATTAATSTTPYGFSTAAQADDLVKTVNALVAAVKALNLAQSS